MKKPELSFTKQEARRWILWKQGLLGEYRFYGKDGVLAFVRQAGCIQYDPIDVCGKNADLVLQSRVKGFTKAMLYELLYTDRKLLDYFDKNLAIFPVEYWNYFKREQKRHQEQERSQADIKQVRQIVLAAIAEKGPLRSADLELSRQVDWYWSKTKLSRAALEHLYFCGELAIHHKKGTMKYYDLVENCIPEDILQRPDPYPEDLEHWKWRIKRRIGSVGLLWNRASDAWLGIPGLKASERTAVFSALSEEGQIVPIQVEGISDTLYALAEDMAAWEKETKKQATEKQWPDKKRCEFIAPLDNLLWDRNLIEQLFGFSYKWEIYTPAAKRKYGYYVLPILYGDRFIGRIELLYDKKNRDLKVKNLWYEPDVKPNKTIEKRLQTALKRFAAFQ